MDYIYDIFIIKKKNLNAPMQFIVIAWEKGNQGFTENISHWFGVTWGLVNNDRTVILVWTLFNMTYSDMKAKILNRNQANPIKL